jgi:hypothetical protein
VKSPISYRALRKDYKRRVMLEFMRGVSTRTLGRRHSLTSRVVQEIIRGQIRLKGGAK